MTSTRRVLAVLLLASASSIAWAQQKVPFSLGVPVAPTGLADQPLPAGPFVYKTAEVQDIRVTVFTKGLEYPYSMAFLPNGDLLVTERPGGCGSFATGCSILTPSPAGRRRASRGSRAPSARSTAT